MGVLRFFVLGLISLSLLRKCSSMDENGGLSDDVLGLMAFKSDLFDPFSHLSSWNEDDTSPCSWRFITCNPATGKVTGVSLDGLNLSGKIGRGLEKLQSLKVLSLSHNNLTGEVNPQLSLLKNLRKLHLAGNQLSGPIPPSLMTSGGVKFLDLSENSLSGRVPEEVFRNCSSLRVLSLSRNRLDGRIPATLSQCGSLNHLNLSSNRFSGAPEFVSGLWRLTRIRKLDLSHNELVGVVPDGAWSLHYLKELRLQGNKLSGGLTFGISQCLHLEKLDLSDNFFIESVPESFKHVSSLTYLNLANNVLTGEFPQWVGELNRLEYLDFSGNRFTGILPTSWFSGRLSVVRLSGNGLTGSIPEGLFGLGLDRLDLSRNRLTGPVPPGSSPLFESLRSLDLSDNGLSGDIPAEIGLFSRLRFLNLSWNGFETRMPPEFGYFENLTVLDLRNAGFHGGVPGDICDSGNIRILQLDGNLLSGSIPDEIRNCSSLYLLSMSHNNLSGSIPRSMLLLKKLKILKLESNQLSGEIPQELGELESLLAVNISHNRLQGRLPEKGIFQSLQKSSLEGNLGICSPLLKGPCKMDVPKPLVLDPHGYGGQMGAESEPSEPSGQGSSHPHRFLSFSAIVAVLAAVAISVGVVVVSVLNVSARRRLAFVNHALESCSMSSRSGGSLAVGRLVWFDRKAAAASRAVDPESWLNKAGAVGGGVLGTVYRASLAAEGGDLAVKSLSVSKTVPHVEDFDREVRVLAKASHPNLVSLKGYYWTPRLQLLVTDFAPNGSLQARLHERSPSTKPLSWPNRFEILQGTANGLAHLHHSFRPPIVHYDIKPGNVLLDEEFNPRVSDFGLTRLLANRFQSPLGYVAPELACGSLRVNEKCDVYGFGMMVLETVTGRRPVEYGEDDVVILNERVKTMLEEGNVLECVDASMGEYPKEEVLPVIKLALVCTSQIPSSRPSMAEVVQILQVIKTPVPRRV